MRGGCLKITKISRNLCELNWEFERNGNKWIGVVMYKGDIGCIKPWNDKGSGGFSILAKWYCWDQMNIFRSWNARGWGLSRQSSKYL